MPVSPLALYIHWPFCKSKCPYCDFNSHVRERVDAASYQQALLAELEFMAAKVPGRKLISIFFGGGTPSLMPPEIVASLIERVKELFAYDDTLEITLEANPTSVESARFRGFRGAGVNRVSLGVQSLRAKSLQFLGREHSASEALRAVELAAAIFPRYSFDMIYALPGQTVSEWQAELKEALAYVRGHMSLYQLTIEENTAFHHEYHQKKSFLLPVDEQAVGLYEATQRMMEDAGMPAYEISNHAAPGQESLHNLAYWRGYEYIGIGPGAHGRLHVEGHWVATQTIKSPERWLEAARLAGHGLESETALSKQERMEEKLLMRLRLTDTIPLAELSLDPNHKFLQLLQEQQLAKVTHSHLQLTEKGRLVQQAIAGELATQIFK